MTRVYSLRLRLVVIILVPLFLVASGVGFWQLRNAQRTTEDVFDRGLLTAALAVANDVAVSEGDALSPEIAGLLENSAGGPVFYHVYAPDGVIVAGYATPPVGIPRADVPLAQPQTFNATYLGRPVSGVRIQTQAEIEGFSGVFTTTVWQDRSLRDAFVRGLILRTLTGLGALLVALAVIVWFGVRYGLRPLVDLERAIARRSSDDLSEIRRPVPGEIRGIVETLNRLLSQVDKTLDAQSQFISNAAHQLRNPIAGVLSLAEAAASAKTEQDMRPRTLDLLAAARQTADLTQRLLLHERARALSPKDSFETHDMRDVLLEWAEGFDGLVPDQVSFTAAIDIPAGTRRAIDQVMLKEALSNLISNAVVHGGAGLTRVSLSARLTRGQIVLSVEDDGIGIPHEHVETALTRFAQVGDGEGSGLGLSIARAIAEAHGGTLSLEGGSGGLRALIVLPV